MENLINNIILNHMYGEGEEGCQITLARLSDDVIMGAVSITLEPGVLPKDAWPLNTSTVEITPEFVRWVLMQYNRLHHQKRCDERYIDLTFNLTAVVQFDGELKDFRILGTSTDTKAALKLLHDELYVLCREDREMTDGILESLNKSGSYTYIEGTGANRYADLFLS